MYLRQGVIASYNLEREARSVEKREICQPVGSEGKGRKKKASAREVSMIKIQTMS